MSPTERPCPNETSTLEQAQPVNKARTHQINRMKRKSSERESSQNDIDPINRYKVRKVSSSTDKSSDIAGGINFEVAKLDTSLLADYVARKNKQNFPQMTPMELEDIHISGNIIYLHLPGIIFDPRKYAEGC